MSNNDSKPKACTDEHLKFLNDMRSGGTYNMFDAAEQLFKRFPSLSRADAYAIHMYWRATTRSK